MFNQNSKFPCTVLIWCTILGTDELGLVAPGELGLAGV